MKQTDFFEKNVISIFDGEFCGKVENLCFCGFKLLGIEIKKDNLKFFVPAKALFSVNKKFVMIKNKSFLMIAQTQKVISFLGKPVVDVFGKSFGKILQVWFSKKFLIEKFSTSNFSFVPKQILSCKNFVVINNKTNFKKSCFAKNCKLKSQKNKIFAPKVSILPKHTNLNKK